MHYHRTLDVALLTTHGNRGKPRQMYGCGNPAQWPLMLGMVGAPLMTTITPKPGSGDYIPSGNYRTAWQAHTTQVAYPEYQYWAVPDAYAGDPRVLTPIGVGDCTTYSLVGTNGEYIGARLYFEGRVFGMAEGNAGAWDFSWTTKLTTGTQTTHDLLFCIATGVNHAYRTFELLRGPDGFLYFKSGGYWSLSGATRWVQTPALNATTRSVTMDFRVLLANTWLRLHYNGSTLTYVFAEHGDPGIVPGDSVQVRLADCHGDGYQGYDENNVWRSRTIQISNIGVVAGYANRFTQWPEE